MIVDLSGYLKAHAISQEVADAAGVRWCSTVHNLPEMLKPQTLFHERYLPGVLFEWHSADLTRPPEFQYRPLADRWNEHRPRQKYDQVPHRLLPLNCHPHRWERTLADDAPLLIVEGTCQYLAAVTYAPPEYGAVGIFGCWGWVRGGLQHPDFNLFPLAGRHVTVIFDADLATNRDVWDAGDRLQRYLKMEGATVAFARVPGVGSSGLDDVLAEDRP